MKTKHLMIALLFFVGITTVQAQRGNRQDAKAYAKKNADTWKKEFELSDDQYKKVYDILVVSGEDRRKKFKDLRNNGGSRDEMRDLYSKMQKETDKKLKKVFTKAQWTKYLQWRKDNPQRRRARKRN